MREQIRVRVDSEQWEGLKCDGEGNTELLGRILSEWTDQKTVLSALTEIDPSPSQALGRLLTSYELMQRATVAIAPSCRPSSSSAPALPNPPSTMPVPVIGGLENNSDEW